ncbi:MAG: recombinase family protein [Reyranella sp.]|nr:recombinase family protein [Reyranella sp.]MBL6851921.1 recombinase family protein [Alphaproteobacteria bacterium]
MRYFIYCRKSSEAEDRQALSIESQKQELKKTFGHDPAIEIVDLIEEAYSAKAPGRPLFDAMMQRIERGEADGIVAWHPDRLARNSVDGGKIIWFLDRRLIRDLKFATYTFENNPQGKFMLSIFLGQSKYYVDALSENVKRGNRTKLAMGWRPSRAPIGYRNCLTTKTIIPDPERFSLVRKMFDVLLEQKASPNQIYVMAHRDWGLRTPKFRRMGGRPLARSAVYRVLSDPFYAGLIRWHGQIYPGKHKPAITIDEFERVQRILRRPQQARPHSRDFPYTGLIRCGACGLAVTAEEKINRQGHRYTYYHCTRRRQADQRCHQRSLRVEGLEAQIVAFLETIKISAKALALARGHLAREDKTRAKQLAQQALVLQTALARTERSLQTLTDLRLQGLIDDAEFATRRALLQQDVLRQREAVAAAQDQTDTFEPLQDVIIFSNRATEWFAAGDSAQKRRILRCVGSNLRLTDGILNIQAAKPFIAGSKKTSCTEVRAVWDDIRTSNDTKERAAFEEIRQIVAMMNKPTSAKREARNDQSQMKANASRMGERRRKT